MKISYDLCEEKQQNSITSISSQASRVSFLNKEETPNPGYSKDHHPHFSYFLIFGLFKFIAVILKQLVTSISRNPKWQQQFLKKFQTQWNEEWNKEMNKEFSKNPSVNPN